MKFQLLILLVLSSASSSPDCDFDNLTKAQNLVCTKTSFLCFPLMIVPHPPNQTFTTPCVKGHSTHQAFITPDMLW